MGYQKGGSACTGVTVESSTRMFVPVRPVGGSLLLVSEEEGAVCFCPLFYSGAHGCTAQVAMPLAAFVEKALVTAEED